MAKKYIGRIKNITTNEWVSDENQGVATHDKLKYNACIFNEEHDALSTCECLNENSKDCYTLIDNSNKVG